ncbi:unnamed protein product [Thelazia callipaeda]|uniref:Large ribosomal subunit protein P1 n=1 Tax=Thelazia callipaeda TaxID=103827 RepID=A0A0N5CX80_THECL|nr:unnamed protein product [Thelazia callipaeda]
MHLQTKVHCSQLELRLGSDVHLEIVGIMSSQELACVYAALILQDDDVAITGDKISTILKAAGVEVEPYWPGLFAKALDGVDVKSLITNISCNVGGGGVAPAAQAAAATESTLAESNEKEDKKKEEPKEESDDDMGFVFEPYLHETYGVDSCIVVYLRNT